MEGAPVTAATGTLGPVVAKLGALLGSEYKLRRRTRKDIKFIRSKLKPVHSILWAAWGEEILDAESKGLKKEALDLADDMLDAIDDFNLTLEGSRRSKHLIKVQTKMKASPFQDFRARVDELSGRCRRKWNSAQPISSLFLGKKNTKPRKPPPPPRAPFVHKAASEIVAMDGWRNDLIRYLVREEEKEEAESIMVQPQLKMASIVGMAGMGKTTLAHLVYEEIGNKFQSRAFVSVTPTPNMVEVLTSILQQVGAKPPAGTQARTQEHIIHTIYTFLENKRYLVIIDDIWHRGEWDIIRRPFPKNNLGSRIVITTRIASLPGDNLDNSMLYMNPEWIQWRQTWVYGCHEQDVAAQMKPDMVGQGFDRHPIVRMCDGVPLALLCMFSAMAMVLREQQEQLGVHVKVRDVQDMIEKQVKKSGIQNTPGFEPLVESLQLGYDDLPHHMLKTCLLYCSVYPENYPFHINDLVMRWVAEGFTYKEDTGKGYFEELCNRGFMLRLQDSLGYYQMNPMMRNFLRWKLREDNFITCSSDITLPYAYPIHRLCIEEDYLVDDVAVEVVDTLLELDWSQIRSLVVFEGAEKYVRFEKLEHVRVLDFQLKSTSALGNHHVKDICKLLRVRHLFGLEEMRISEIPPEIARLQYLETLQVIFTRTTELPSEIGDLQQLKRLTVSGNDNLAELPREVWDLQHLETLELSYNNRLTELPREIGNLQNLENLNLHDTKLKELPREIGKLQHLKTLEVGREITRLPSEIGDLPHLESLDLSGNLRLTQLPREIWKLENLKRLILGYTEVRKIPREIGGLKKLEKLDVMVSVLPWQVSQLSELEGAVPECIRQAWKNSDLASELAGEILSIQVDSCNNDYCGLIIGKKHMGIPGWIKDHFNNLGSLDIRMCKLEERDLKILLEMPRLEKLTLRFEVVPKKPIAISGEGFPSLRFLVVDSRMPPVITFQKGAMPWLVRLDFEFQFYGGQPANNDAQLGIKNLRHLQQVVFRCNEEWYGGAGAESNPCMSAMIDVVRKEAQEHPNQILFCISGREDEEFPANKSTQASTCGTSETDDTPNSGTGEIQEKEQTFPVNESAQVCSSGGTGEIVEA